jgi:hypothetical protein
MIFTPQDIQRLLEIVEYHSSFVAGSTLGKEVLTDYDRFILNKHGIDPDKLKAGKDTNYFDMYLWGRLSTVLSDNQYKQLTFQDFEQYVKRGQYIPLTKQEQSRYDIAKQKTYGHIKGLGDKMKQTVNGIIVEQDQKLRAEYEKVIKGELEKGVVDRKSVSSIVSEIGNKTEDWNKDWGRIVETESQNIFNQGRAEGIAAKKGVDALVFKDVFPQACRFCIKFYLTQGIGSKPIVYKLSELIANGSNIGKKQSDWKPTLYSVHSWCRCTLRSLPEGYEWDEEKGMFTPKKKENKIKRKSKVKVTIGNKEFMV